MEENKIKYNKILNNKYVKFFILATVLLFIWVYRVFISDTNIRFYVADESDIINEADFSIYLNDSLIISDSIFQSPEWIIGKSYYEKLSPGIHNIKVKSSKFNYLLEKEVCIFYTHTVFVKLINPDSTVIANSNELGDIFSIRTKVGRGITIE